MDWQKVLEDALSHPDLRGTFVQGVLVSMASGDFVEPDEEVGPGEEVIGEMNAFEKALFSLVSMHIDEEKEHVLSMVNIEARGGPTDESRKAMHARFKTLAVRSKISRYFFWFSVENRLGLKTKPESVGFGVRAGFKVVALPPPTEVKESEAKIRLATPGEIVIVEAGPILFGL